MPLQFFNTLSRQKEAFVPLDTAGKKVGMYTCGPTVYNYAHIGNLRAFMFEDLLRRYLEYKGYAVTHVMNITDVEDKIIRTVRETGKSLKEFTDFFTQEFLRDLDTLNIKRAHILPRATDTIPGMIKLIETLIAKQHAYVGDDGSVYFSIKSFPDYGKLGHLDMENLQHGARVQHDEYAKENVADFALWKAWCEADGAVKWDSPWGAGRPGWHIECSVMSMAHLGESFDIHCGGEDLIFPHHEDEIAQSEAATGKPFVKYWLHNAHLLVEGKKMSKSLGNFFTLRDLQKDGWTGREVRYVLISGHYREQLNFTKDGLTGARSALQRIDEFLLKMMDVGRLCESAAVSADSRSRPTTLASQFESALDDDLNISGTLGTIFEFIRDANKRTISPEEAAGILATWQRLDSVLGFGIPAKADVPADVLALVEERQAARKSKNFKRSDEIRDQLKAQGWVIEDTPPVRAQNVFRSRDLTRRTCSKSMPTHHSPTPPLTTGQRIFTCGHSFHFWVPDFLTDMAKAAGIRDHHTVGTSIIGASLTKHHWDVPDEQNQAKQALRAVVVDVLTLSCMTRPDEGIRHFATLAVAHNPNVRVTLQELWLPEDRFPFDPTNRVRKSVDEFNGATLATLYPPHQAYCKVMEDYVTALNAELGKQVVFIVPDAQATLALRARIMAGTAPGLTKQSDLFTDEWGHPSPPLQLLSAYDHFAVIYRRSPVGLPMPGVLATEPQLNADLNRLLQVLAWDAVTQHPLSGLRPL